ncbi:TetR/AcrR family transcriptional regulator [Sphingomonas sp. PAMC 26617]|uniref:TetR/AcrR family transcriptional regulator n=1 Tax=Sphingomonas sp. PAMC 26617 TaxID=1112216 RepID=UPI0002897DA3|nr:TetR/AcrR family transcriptional regulator [Sphingomonas sp. PAMC 26617]
MTGADISTDGKVAENARSRIVAAAVMLIAAGGRSAVTTRAVAAAAGVQAPTIYRLFGDKRGLLDAVAENGLAEYVAKKSLRQPHPDPVQDLRIGWDMHVTFGLEHPGLFTIMSGDPELGPASPPVSAGLNVLRQRIRNIALAGRLRISETRALALVQAMCVGTVLTLLGEPADRRDSGLSEVAREATMAAITGEARVSAQAGPSGAAAALRASLDHVSVLSSGEKLLLEELLNRIADSAS